MLVEPVTPPVVGPADPVGGGATAADRAKAARTWLELGRHVATRPGVADPTPGMRDALTHATDAIREAIEACGDLHEIRNDLHLALDEATGGLAQLAEPGQDARVAALRTTNLAAGILDRAIAALGEVHDTTPGTDDPVR
ncbi:MAG: hypothetical protein KDC46_10420 [Thermoleophilia bacterium]|nr:hypothetical protein [Thermoleophilia bacterium]